MSTQTELFDSSVGPLAGVRILALEQYGAGPFGTAQLVDLGAEVIKVEDPSSSGDVGRSVPPFRDEQGSLFFETFNRGKKSILLDLENPSGRLVFEGLVRESDAVFANVRGDVPEALRIRYADLSHVNKKIVCCFLTAFGASGTARDMPGYDYVVQGRAGWMTLNGGPNDVPQKTGLSLVDFSTGLTAAMALVSGLYRAREDGVGMDCDVSLFDTAISMLSYVGTWSLSKDYVPQRSEMSAHPSLVPFQNFPTLDGWIVIACAKEKFWKRLTEVVGRPEWKTDPRYSSFESRGRNAKEIIEKICECLAEKSSAHWLHALTAAGVPCGPVNDVSQALRDPLVKERGMVIETQHPTLGTVRQIASAARVGHAVPVVARAPLLGENTRQMVTSLLNVPDEEFDRIADLGAFGQTISE